MTGIYESLLEEGYSFSFIDKDTAKTYLKWISYVPKFWNTEEVLKNNEDSLKAKDWFIKFLNDEKEKSSDNILKVHKFIKSHKLTDLIESKMSPYEVEYCNESMEFLKNSYEECARYLNMVKDIPLEERTIIEDYLLLVLTPKLNKMIEDKIKPILVEDSSIDSESSKLLQMIK